jgi:hypothetical protein
MKYKESTRSPGYGKIFMKDLNGRITEELDLLRVIVLEDGKDFTVGELLGLVVVNQAQVDKIKGLEG